MAPELSGAGGEHRLHAVLHIDRFFLRQIDIIGNSRVQNHSADGFRMVAHNRECQPRAIGFAVEINLIIAQSRANEGHIRRILYGSIDTQIKSMFKQTCIALAEIIQALGNIRVTLHTGNHSFGQSNQFRAVELRLRHADTTLVEQNDVALPQHRG